MPYSNVNELPDNVKTLPEEKQKQWLEVFNSSYKQYLDKGESPKDAETHAFQTAWGVVKKESRVEIKFKSFPITDEDRQEALEKMEVILPPLSYNIDLRLLNGKHVNHGGRVSLNDDGLKQIGFDLHKAVETITERQLKFESFSWVRPIVHYPERGRLYRVVATGEILDHTDETGKKFQRILSPQEIERGTRTLAGKMVNLDHTPSWMRNGMNAVVDAEPEDNVAECICYVEDEEINQLYDDGKLMGASVEYWPREETIQMELTKIHQHGVMFSGLAFLTETPAFKGSKIELITKEAFEEMPIQVSSAIVANLEKHAVVILAEMEAHRAEERERPRKGNEMEIDKAEELMAQANDRGTITKAEMDRIAQLDTPAIDQEIALLKSEKINMRAQIDQYYADRPREKEDPVIVAWWDRMDEIDMTIHILEETKIRNRLGLAQQDPNTAAAVVISDPAIPPKSDVNAQVVIPEPPKPTLKEKLGMSDEEFSAYPIWEVRRHQMGAKSDAPDKDISAWLQRRRNMQKLRS